MRRSTRPIVLRGVESNSKGVTVELEGDFNEIVAVFMSEKATANILSFAAQVDAGANIQPTVAHDTYSFSRKNIPGSEGRFYCCDVRTMISRKGKSAGGLARAIRALEMAMLQTVQQNLINSRRGRLSKLGEREN